VETPEVPGCPAPSICLPARPAAHIVGVGAPSQLHPLLFVITQITTHLRSVCHIFLILLLDLSVHPAFPGWPPFLSIFHPNFASS